MLVCNPHEMQVSPLEVMLASCEATRSRPVPSSNVGATSSRAELE